MWQYRCMFISYEVSRPQCRASIPRGLRLGTGLWVTVIEIASCHGSSQKTMCGCRGYQHVALLGLCGLAELHT